MALFSPISDEQLFTLPMERAWHGLSVILDCATGDFRCRFVSILFVGGWKPLQIQLLAGNIKKQKRWLHEKAVATSWKTKNERAQSLPSIKSKKRSTNDVHLHQKLLRVF
ncbi:hypothetical protein M9H77_24362 [Catharanthus roseus]|uniref:Uncharacterized protein n=1 Tax=Catharanthus roseus TaxID=4058 RepID=A0ACC0AY35_CATRO|nr:hypothetical protein M9H77_24362 [Catharanthus roseus]